MKTIEERVEILEEQILVLHKRSIVNQGALPAKEDTEKPTGKKEKVFRPNNG